MEEGRQVGDGGSGSGRTKSFWQIAVERRMSSISQAAKVQELAASLRQAHDVIMGRETYRTRSVAEVEDTL